MVRRQSARCLAAATSVHSWEDTTSIPGRNGIAVARHDGITGIRHHLSTRFRRLRRTVRKALALAPRGFVRRDVLVLTSVSARLRLVWRTRDIHPWDRHLPTERRIELFREQAVKDTEAAIARCFHLLPEVEEIEIRVLAPSTPDTVVLAGTVARRDAVAVRAIASPRMRLALMGIRLDLTAP
jgi:hypothetical protein